MRVKYDKNADAVYIKFQHGKKKVAKTVKLQDFCLVDVGNKGKLYGIEILNASEHIPIRGILTVKTIGKKMASA